MTENLKNLEKKSVNLKGSQYVLVKDRVLFFNENYPSWKITCDFFVFEWTKLCKAIIIPDVENPNRFFTGTAEVLELWWFNKMKFETAETSAVWRALAMMWIWVVESIASIDEININKNAIQASKNTEIKKTEKTIYADRWFLEKIKKIWENDENKKNIISKYLLKNEVEFENLTFMQANELFVLITALSDVKKNEDVNVKIAEIKSLCLWDNNINNKENVLKYLKEINKSKLTELSITELDDLLNFLELNKF